MEKQFFSSALLTAIICALCSEDGSGAAAVSGVEHFVVVVNSWKPMAIFTKRSILDVAAVLDPPLMFLPHTWAVPMLLDRGPSNQ